MLLKTVSSKLKYRGFIFNGALLLLNRNLNHLRSNNTQHYRHVYCAEPFLHTLASWKVFQLRAAGFAPFLWCTAAACGLLHPCD